MVTLDTYSPTRTEPASMHRMIPKLIIPLASTAWSIYSFIRWSLDSAYGAIALFCCFGGVMFLIFIFKKQQVPAKDGQLLLSNREVTFNSREDNFRIALKDVNSITLTYSGHDFQIFANDTMGAENRIAIMFRGGRTFKRTIEIANRRQKKALKREIEELRKAGVRNITIRNASESEWGKF